MAERLTSAHVLDPFEIADIVLSFLNKPEVSTVGLVITTLLAVVLWRWPRVRAGRLTFKYYRTQVLGSKDRKLPVDVEILYRGAKIEHLCRTLVPIWNTGAAIIRGSNIVPHNPLRLDIGQDAKVLDAQIIKTTSDVTKCFVAPLKGSESEVIIGFEFLEPGDGCVVEIFHTDTKNKPKLDGTVQEMPRGFLSLGGTFPPPLLIHFGFTALGIPALVGLVFFIVNAFVIPPRFEYYAIALLGIIISGLFFFASLSGILHFLFRVPKKLQMPQFTSR